MTEKIDLKQLERKAYLSYHQDGLLDIFIGLAIVTLGIIFLPGIFEYSFPFISGIFIVWIISFAGIKRALTVPRIGYIEFTIKRKSRFVLLVALLFVINVIVFLVLSFGLLTPEIRLMLNEMGVIIVAIVVGGLFMISGIITEIRRFLGYGVFAFIVFVVDHFFRLHLSIPTLAFGTMMTVTGFVLLFRFLRKYPKVKSSGEYYDNWEGEQDRDNSW